jgi:hypothetical protein
VVGDDTVEIDTKHELPRHRHQPATRDTRSFGNPGGSASVEDL